MEIKAIDVSSVQGKPDWKKAAASGIKAAILRVHQKYGTDTSFEHNYAGCRKNGIMVGVYKYSYAKTAIEAQAEAQAVLDALSGRKLDFPVFYDLEWADQRALGKDKITRIAKAFLEHVREAGYIPAIYCNVDWYSNVLSVAGLPYDYWLASYPDKKLDNGTLRERLRPSVGVGWQYSSKGKVPGISGDVDMDVFYKDYKTKKGASTMTKTEKAILQMEAWAKDNSHGYDQAYRWGEKGDYDCSSAVITAWELAGIPVKSRGATYTGNMYQVFLACGFKDVTKAVNLATGAGLKRGDVLLNHTHHTAMYCGNGKEVEASINEKGTATGGRPGDQTGREFLIQLYRNYPWNAVLRYSKEIIFEKEKNYMFEIPTVKKGEMGKHVLLVQEILSARGYTGKDGKPLQLDRDCGVNTVYAIKKYQKEREKNQPGICGRTDGVADKKTLQDMIAL